MKKLLIVAAEAGLRAENYFISVMNLKGIPIEFIDDWFDFLVNKNIKVEVKSTKLSIKNGKKSKFKSGRYDFTDEENREKQFNENIWICLIIRNGDDFMIQGFIKAKELQMKRYLSIPHAGELKLIDLNSWISRVLR